MDAQGIVERVLAGERLGEPEAEELFSCHDLPLLSVGAHAMRMRMHPQSKATYILERNINYTNVCAADCEFCGFHVSVAESCSGDGYVLSREELHSKIAELVGCGGRQILMQGGLNPRLKLNWHEEMLRGIKSAFDIHIHAYSPPEIAWFAKLNHLSVRDVICRLHAAGLDSIPGGGAEILVDRVRSQITRNKVLTGEWLDVMRTAAECGLRTTATMMYGHVETMQERVTHLSRLRQLQDETGVFTAFIAWPFQRSAKTRLQTPPAGAHEYLRTIAVARMFLDNIANVQASWVTMGARTAQLALFFGCNDMGSTMMEENVVTGAGTSHQLTARQLERLIREAGFEPARRNFHYDEPDTQQGTTPFLV